MINRKNKDKYYIDIADAVSSRGTCLRRNYGAVIVKEDRIISTGYTGAPRNCINCSDIGKCKREELHIPSGERYELCNSVHAEQNAIIQANGQDLIDSTIYISGRDAKTGKKVDGMPCLICQKMIINAGIKKVIIGLADDEVKIIPISELINNFSNTFQN